MTDPNKLRPHELAHEVLQDTAMDQALDWLIALQCPLPGQRALQGDQPVEGLVHSRVLQHLMSQLMGAQFIRVRHGVPRVFATFYSTFLQLGSTFLSGEA